MGEATNATNNKNTGPTEHTETWHTEAACWPTDNTRQIAVSSQTLVRQSLRKQYSAARLYPQPHPLLCRKTTTSTRRNTETVKIDQKNSKNTQKIKTDYSSSGGGGDLSLFSLVMLLLHSSHQPSMRISTTRPPSEAPSPPDPLPVIKNGKKDQDLAAPRIGAGKVLNTKVLLLWSNLMFCLCFKNYLFTFHNWYFLQVKNTVLK